MSLYDDLVQWSRYRPIWQRDALRRLAQQGNLTEGDLDQLVEIALGTAVEGTPPEPLAEAHVPAAGADMANVGLVAISEPTNVNALAPHSRLDFEPHGLTAIYGDNAAGKSGYVRILKRVCRARSIPARILPNVMLTDTSPTSADIEYTVNGDIRIRPWTPGDTVSDELGSISVFDRDCAAVYVTEENEVAYRPLGLDLLDSLARVARTIRTRIEQRRNGLVLATQAPSPAIAGADVLLDIWPIDESRTRGALSLAPPWTAESAKRMQEIQFALATPTPADAAAGLRARQRTLTRAVDFLEDVSRDFGLAQELAGLDARLREGERVLEESRRVLEDNELAGTGGPLWRTLWAAAARFSEEVAYVGHAFPYVAAGARCVLCGQALSETAVARFRELAAALAAEFEEELPTLRAQVADAQAAADRLKVLTPSPPYDDLRVADLESAMAYQTACQSMLDGAPSGNGGELTADVDRVPATVALLRERAALLERQADLIARAAEPTGQDEIRDQLRGLQAQQWISQQAAHILADLETLRLRRTMQSAIADCDTHAITVESGVLTERYVTEALRNSLADELNGLSARRVRVRIVPRGALGSVYHRFELDGAMVADVRVAEVVSEGEFRAIALATFFAELAQSTSNSAIVLDDPVSSFDHLNRARVAQRVVAEAQRRQVIVFTHDLVFLHDLAGAAESTGASIGYRRLRLTPTHAGWPLAEPPWLGMKVRQRVEFLQTELNRIRAVWESGDIDTYERDARSWYGSLRETWERAVEEILFGDAISRYRHQVKTNNLITAKVWLATEADVETIRNAVTTASEWIRGHDQPAAVNRPAPEPDALHGDLATLRDWAAAIRVRRQAG